MKDEYVAYVGTYTHGSSIGIHLYDVNVEEGTLTERKVIPVNNSSHIARSLNGKYLYSIADEGVAVFAVEDDGDLTPINKVDIDGMRGCYIFLMYHFDSIVFVLILVTDCRALVRRPVIYQNNFQISITLTE